MALVIVVLWLPVLMLVPIFVIDVGNWFVHDRHLQLQADAGALAAAGDFRFPCENGAIEATAQQYAGDETGDYNLQVGGTSPDDIQVAINKRAYPGQPSNIDATLEQELPPCEAGLIDVKVTETDLPLLFRVADMFTSVPFINAHARVNVFSKRAVSGGLPVAVPNSDPRKGRVTFVDEVSGTVLGSSQLSFEESDEGLAYWSSVGDPFPLSVESERIGVRVALSGAESTECGDPLVQCYPAGSSEGLLFARGWSAAGDGAQPKEPLARDVHLLSGSCDPYFSSEESGCTVGVHADIDFGPCAEIDAVGAELTAVAAGNSYPLERIGCPGGTGTSEWETSGAPIAIPAGGGPISISLEWEETKGEIGSKECNNKGGNKCTGTFDEVQRTFAGDGESSGPIRLAQIEDGAGAWANSFERCSVVPSECTYPVWVRIAIDQKLQQNAESAEEPPIPLRLFREADGGPNQNQALDCEDGPSLREEIANGCAPVYARNQGTACPSPGVLWESEEPWECVAPETGGTVNQIYFGMNERVYGSVEPSECVSPNDWSSFPELDPDDPRILPVFLTPFGSFSETGKDETVPVTDFAVFYVTGWAGQGGGKSSNEICEGDDEAEAGTIVGHFIKYVQSFNDGSADEETTCDFDSPTPCVAVLTR